MRSNKAQLLTAVTALNAHVKELAEMNTGLAREANLMGRVWAPTNEDGTVEYGTFSLESQYGGWRLVVQTNVKDCYKPVSTGGFLPNAELFRQIETITNCLGYLNTVSAQL